MVPGLKELSYSDRLRQLKLSSLVYRRIRGDMIETFKIMQQKYDSPDMSPAIDGHHTRGHRYKLFKSRPKTRLRQHFFTARIIDTWNSLPSKVVEAPSVKAFEHRLDRYWRNQDIIYEYDSDLKSSCHREINVSSVSSDSDLDIYM